MYTKVTCELCKKEFDRLTKEVKRSEKIGRNFYCGGSCAIRHRNLTTTNEGFNKSRFGRVTRVQDTLSSFRSFVRVAKQRKHEVAVTAEYLRQVFESQGGKCPLTGVSLTLPYRGKALRGESTPLQASLDRIDSSKGYVEGNVRFISLMANLAKQCWTDKELIDFCKKVVENCCNPSEGEVVNTGGAVPPLVHQRVQIDVCSGCGSLPGLIERDSFL